MITRGKNKDGNTPLSPEELDDLIPSLATKEELDKWEREIARARKTFHLTNIFESCTKRCSTKPGIGPESTAALKKTSEL